MAQAISRIWNRRCWIACTPRSGSTWLSCLLNLAAGLDERQFPIDASCTDYFGEHYHPSSRERLEAIGGVPNVTKAHNHWLGRVKIPTDAAVILLTRDDKEAQARSHATAESCKLHNTHDAGARYAYHNAYTDVDPDRVKTLEHRYGRQSRFIERATKSFERICLTYEELEADAEGTVDRVIRELNLLDLWEFKPSTLLKMRPVAS